MRAHMLQDARTIFKIIGFMQNSLALKKRNTQAMTTRTTIAAVAQTVEHLPCKQAVDGSIPVRRPQDSCRRRRR